MHSAENTGKAPDSRGLPGRQKQIRNMVNSFCRVMLVLYMIVFCDSYVRMISSPRNGIGRVWTIGKKVRNWRVHSRIARD